MKRYGPYDTGQGHLFWVDVADDGSRRSVFVHRELMEQHLGRVLTETEVVHHINENKKDNRIENLVVMDRGEHNSVHSDPPETIETVCAECEERMFALARRFRYNQIKKGGSGPFCSRRCAGKFNARLRVY